MKLVFFEIVIANILDDSTRSVIAVCDESDDVIDHIHDIAPYYANLNEYSEESIWGIKRIPLENISATSELFDKVNDVLADKPITK